MTTSRHISITSGVNMKGTPFVTLAWGDEAGQLTPEEAKAHAVKVLECAAAAEYDAALVKALGGKLDETTGALLSAIREARGGSRYGSAGTSITPKRP